MDEERLLRSKKRALVKRAAVFNCIKAVFDLGTLSESDMDARDQFLVAVNDLTDLWSKFVIENNAVLDAMVDLNEDQSFSNSTELGAL